MVLKLGSLEQPHQFHLGTQRNAKPGPHHRSTRDRGAEIHALTSSACDSVAGLSLQTTSLEKVERTEVGGRGGGRICDVEGSPALVLPLELGE